jgi:diguanylate cyclase (GGDEF)-like protein/PAS domain S-box-containing protein
MRRQSSSRLELSHPRKHSSILRMDTPDVAERRHARELVHLLHSQVLAIIDSNNDAIFAMTLDGVIVSWNRAAERIYGYSTDEIIGKSVSVLSLPELQDDLPQLLGMMERGKTVDHFDTVAIQNGGSRICVSVSISPILDDQGKLLGASTIARDISEQKRVEESIKRLASHDSLTDLANYRSLMDALHAELRRSDRTGRPFALLLLDVDRLKQINDTHGHLVGSRALCRLADVLKRTCRSIDTAARYGGDEFAILLVETGGEIASQVARRIMDMLAKDEENPPVTVSTGVAVYPQDGFDVESLLMAADRLLYKNKLRASIQDKGDLKASG